MKILLMKYDQNNADPYESHLDLHCFRPFHYENSMSNSQCKNEVTQSRPQGTL